jgi:hypothetical protein
MRPTAAQTAGAAPLPGLLQLAGSVHLGPAMSGSRSLGGLFTLWAVAGAIAWVA